MKEGDLGKKESHSREAEVSPECRADDDSEKWEGSSSVSGS